jgi:hypothetical protein
LRSLLLLGLGLDRTLGALLAVRVSNRAGNSIGRWRWSWLAWRWRTTGGSGSCVGITARRRRHGLARTGVDWWLLLLLLKCLLSQRHLLVRLLGLRVHRRRDDRQLLESLRKIGAHGRSPPWQ